MRYFNYRAIDSTGTVHRGSIPAATLEEVEGKLSRRGLELLACRPSFAWFKNHRSPVTRKQLIDFTFHLQQMEQAGVPILDSLHEYQDASDQKHLQSVASGLIDQIESGSSLSGASELQPDVFKPMYTSMLRAGEESGRLVEVLTDLLDLLKWHDESLSSIRRVLIYPAFVCVVLMVVIGFVMTWLVPSLLSFITSAGGELPWHTRWLIGVSEFVSRFGLIAVLVVVSVGLLIGRACKYSNTTRSLWHRVQLNLPLAGSVLYKMKLARFCRCSALMYASGINLIDTLKHGEALVDNLVLGKALRNARNRIVAGDNISDAFKQQTELPRLLSRMLKVGESTGGMDEAFLHSSYFYDRDCREAIDRLEQFIGPVLIVFVGAVMAWVVVSVIGPIYDLVFGLQGAM